MVKCLLRKNYKLAVLWRWRSLINEHAVAAKNDWSIEYLNIYTQNVCIKYNIWTVSICGCKSSPSFCLRSEWYFNYNFVWKFFNSYNNFLNDAHASSPNDYYWFWHKHRWSLGYSVRLTFEEGCIENVFDCSFSVFIQFVLKYFIFHLICYFNVNVIWLMGSQAADFGVKMYNRCHYYI